jgi:hypothetical protein
MNGPLDCPFCKQRPTHWYVEEGQPYVVCDNHSEPIKMRLSDWNGRAPLVGDKRRSGSVDAAPLAQSIEPPQPTDDLSRRIGWLRHAMYNIEVGRCHDAREHAHEALRIDDLISGRASVDGGVTR